MGAVEAPIAFDYRARNIDPVDEHRQTVPAGKNDHRAAVGGQRRSAAENEAAEHADDETC
jgi:hypothetical protein